MIDVNYSTQSLPLARIKSDETFRTFLEASLITKKEEN